MLGHAHEKSLRNPKQTYFGMHWQKTIRVPAKQWHVFGNKNVLDWQNPRCHIGRRCQLMKYNFIKLTDQLIRPFPSSKNRYLENEAMCKNPSCENEFYLNKNKNRFHINGFALSLVLKQRLKATRKCSICFRKRFNPWLFERQPVDWWLALMKGWHSNLQLWISLRTEVFFINLVEQIDFFLPSPRSIFFVLLCFPFFG